MFVFERELFVCRVKDVGLGFLERLGGVVTCLGVLFMDVCLDLGIWSFGFCYSWDILEFAFYII